MADGPGFFGATPVSKGDLVRELLARAEAAESALAEYRRLAEELDARAAKAAELCQDALNHDPRLGNVANHHTSMEVAYKDAAALIRERGEQ